MPLRANLVVLENIAVVPQYIQNMRYQDAVDVAWNLLLQAGYTDAAYKRDPALSHEERFVAKLLRAAVSRPGLLLIDRPAMLLPDTRYPPFVEDVLKRLDNQLNDCWILDYQWNEPLYAPL
jgi:ABC-type histidine transport system ATPase subunit